MVMVTMTVAAGTEVLPAVGAEVGVVSEEDRPEGSGCGVDPRGVLVQEDLAAHRQVCEALAPVLVAHLVLMVSAEVRQEEDLVHVGDHLGVAAWDPRAAVGVNPSGVQTVETTAIPMSSSTLKVTTTPVYFSKTN